MSNPSDTDIAWLAGLLEGEGCFLVSRRKGWRPSIYAQIRMSDRDVIERVATMLGCEYREESPRNPSPAQVALGYTPDNWSTMWIIRVGGDAAERVMRLVRPHMGQRRGAKIDEILAEPPGTYSHQPRIKEGT